MKMEMLQVVAGVGAVFVAALVYMIKNLLQVCEPSEVLVISGQSNTVGNRTVGYKWVKGGRAVVYPLIEKLHRMDLRNLTIELTVKGAYSKGGVPLNISGVANVKVCGDQPLLNNAIERFLGTPPEHIIQIAKETLEGNLRGVLATLTPEEVNHDKIRFAQSLLEEADKDLHKLGLTLDNLKIQNVSDDVGYLNSIGRKKRAEQMLTNRLAEAENRTASAINEAENHERTVLTNLDNRLKILRAEGQTKILDATSRRPAVVAEQEAAVAKDVARAEAEIGVYKALIEQVKHKLRADVLQPADAERKRAISEAQAHVAPIRENGAATAQMLRHVITAWKHAGPRAREVFLMQKLDGLIDTVVGTVPPLTVDRVTIIGADGASAGGVQLAAMFDALRGSLGFAAPPAAPAPRTAAADYGDPFAEAVQQRAKPAVHAAPARQEPAPEPRSSEQDIRVIEAVLGDAAPPEPRNKPRRR